MKPNRIIEILEKNLLTINNNEFREVLEKIISRYKSISPIRPLCLYCNQLYEDDYMITKELWKSLGLDRGFLHLICLEKMLGRKLVKEDFPNVICNSGIRWLFNRGIP